MRAHPQATGGRAARAGSQGLALASAQNNASAEAEDSDSEAGDEEVRKSPDLRAVTRSDFPRPCTPLLMCTLFQEVDIEAELGVELAKDDDEEEEEHGRWQCVPKALGPPSGWRATDHRAG